jgi:hypothetical protein
VRTNKITRDQLNYNPFGSKPIIVGIDPSMNNNEYYGETNCRSPKDFLNS